MFRNKINIRKNKFKGYNVRKIIFAYVFEVKKYFKYFSKIKYFLERILLKLWIHEVKEKCHTEHIKNSIFDFK